MIKAHRWSKRIIKHMAPLFLPFRPENDSVHHVAVIFSLKLCIFKSTWSVPQPEKDKVGKRGWVDEGMGGWSCVNKRCKCSRKTGFLSFLMWILYPQMMMWKILFTVTSYPREWSDNGDVFSVFNLVLPQ